MHIREALTELRRLRLKAQYHSAKAAEYMARAGKGMSTHRANNISGTGNCPLVAYTEAYSREHAAASVAANAANAIWAQVLPLLDGAGLDERSVIELFYNQGDDWQDISKRIKRNIEACYRMHREMVHRVETMQCKTRQNDFCVCIKE